MTLGTWFRDYVYIPLGGNRVSRGRWVCNIFVVWMLTGLWHGAAWNFVLWGLLFAVLLLLEKCVPRLKNLPGVLAHGYVILVVMLSFVLFNGESLGQVSSDFLGLLGIGVPGVTEEALYYLRSYGGLFLLGLIGATPLMRDLWRKLEARPGWGKATLVLEPVLLGLLLLLCTAYLVDGSFNPFLYFRF